ncbi:MAG: hypothetical protein HQ557_15230 [Bacteroidetes bacterium]|nr:hypothetical protein [Bacteroidota bacterium]
MDTKKTRKQNIAAVILLFALSMISATEPAPFTNPDYRDLEPHITTDGKRLFFDSIRPKPGSPSPNN